MRRVIALLLLASFIPAYAAGLIDERGLVVSMYRLIATPQAYQGKRILLHGYLHMYQKSGVLYVNETAKRYGLQVDGVYLSFTSSQVEAYRPNDGTWVFVEGTFQGRQDESVLNFAGTLENITRLKRMDGRAR